MLALALASAVPLSAEEASGRYTMSPTDGGAIRLDTKTGAMALCTRKGDDRLACEDMADSQRKLLDANARLEAENKSLKEQVRHLEETLGLGEGQADAAKPKLSLPSEEDVDKAFDYLEKMLSKLRERMEKLEKKRGPGDGSAL
jgi:hypothetical protein